MPLKERLVTVMPLERKAELKEKEAVARGREAMSVREVQMDSKKEGANIVGGRREERREEEEEEGGGGG